VSNGTAPNPQQTVEVQPTLRKDSIELDLVVTKTSRRPTRPADNPVDPRDSAINSLRSLEDLMGEYMRQLPPPPGTSTENSEASLITISPQQIDVIIQNTIESNPHNEDINLDLNNNNIHTDVNYNNENFAHQHNIHNTLELNAERQEDNVNNDDQNGRGLSDGQETNPTNEPVVVVVQKEGSIEDIGTEFTGNMYRPQSQIQLLSPEEKEDESENENDTLV